MAINDQIEIPSTLETSQQMGPVDRLMDPIMRKALTTLTPSKYQAGLLNNYSNNRTAWNTGTAALSGLGIAAALKAMSSAFGNKDDDNDYEYVPRRRRRKSSGSAFGNAMSWLAPMALLAGGTYLWNKHGDKVVGKVNEGLTNLRTAVAADKKWETRYKNILDTVRKIPLLGNWAANKIHNTVDKGI